MAWLTRPPLSTCYKIRGTFLCPVSCPNGRLILYPAARAQNWLSGFVPLCHFILPPFIPAVVHLPGFMSRVTLPRSSVVDCWILPPVGPPNPPWMVWTGPLHHRHFSHTASLSSLFHRTGRGWPAGGSAVCVHPSGSATFQHRPIPRVHAPDDIRSFQSRKVMALGSLFLPPGSLLSFLSPWLGGP